MEGKNIDRGGQLDYKTRCFNTLKKINEIIRSPDFMVVEEGNKSQIEELAKRKGYRVEEVHLGDPILDDEGKIDYIKNDNSVRMGFKDGKKFLYVAVDEEKEPVDIEDLRHDVGTILLGGKAIDATAETTRLSLEYIHEFYRQQGREVINTDADYVKAGVATLDPNGHWVIQSSHLLDCVRHGTFRTRKTN